MIYVCFLNNHKLNLRRIKNDLFCSSFIFFSVLPVVLRNLRNRHIESFKMTQKPRKARGFYCFFKQFSTSSTARFKLGQIVQSAAGSL